MARECWRNLRSFDFAQDDTLVGGLEMQVPPLRFASVGMTKGWVTMTTAYAQFIPSMDASARCAQ